MASNLRLIITTGDVDGIGWEVTAKALSKMGPQKNVQFLVYRSSTSTHLKPKISKFKIQPVSSLEAALSDKFDAKWLVEIRSPKPPAAWVEEAARACSQKVCDGMVTGPLSKTSILSCGLKDIGHTEILGRVSGRSNLFMSFIGKKFNVVLATGHLPLEEAVQSLSMDKLSKAVRAAGDLKNTLPPALRKLPLAVVGVNPHAGEEGLLGLQEGWFRGLLDTLQLEVGRIAGPLVPDAAFLQQNWKKYSAYICPYHDQGLIPFKMIHGFGAGVHLTLGLPFVRTSVDHGTAKDIFGKNKANPGSMRDAIKTAIQMARAKKQEKSL